MSKAIILTWLDVQLEADSVTESKSDARARGVSIVGVSRTKSLSLDRAVLDKQSCGRTSAFELLKRAPVLFRIWVTLEAGSVSLVAWVWMIFKLIVRV